MLICISFVSVLIAVLKPETQTQRRNYSTYGVVGGGARRGEREREEGGEKAWEMGNGKWEMGKGAGTHFFYIGI
jgi:hypothetical protein